MMSGAPSPLRSTGLTAMKGSTSLLGKTVPGWAETLSAVHAANGLAPDVCSSGETVAVVAQAAGTATKTVAAASAVTRRPVRNACISAPPTGARVLGHRTSTGHPLGSLLRAHMSDKSAAPAG